jgi:hypothetical protein
VVVSEQNGQDQEERPAGVETEADSATERDASHGADDAAAADREGTDHDADVVDELPDDLNAAGYVGPYMFPDNARRRVPAYLYLLTAGVCLLAWAAVDSPYVNDGFLFAAVLLVAFGLYAFVAGWPLDVDERDALVAATKQVGFPVGHASAQLGWRGLLSRPTWRILLYSSENPPVQRGLVLVDGVDGAVVQHFVEDNPEDWSDDD